MNKGKEVSKQSQFNPLRRVANQMVLLRVGGRFTRVDLPYDAIHPMILNKKHRIIRLIVTDGHNCCHHVGVNRVLPQVEHRCRIIVGSQ